MYLVWNKLTFHLNSNVHNCFISHAGYSLNTKLYVPCVRFSVAGLDHSKLGLYRFQTLFLIVVIVISIILETAFWQTPFHSQSLVKDKDIKQLLRRLKSIDRHGLPKTASKHLNLLKLFRNVIILDIVLFA